ncbi:hypothetical protein BHE74_00020422 [Ensete ventricosum]|nr:hypothetical protein BHE74_00020422 [Ensete ventricosum]
MTSGSRGDDDGDRKVGSGSALQSFFDHIPVTAIPGIRASVPGALACLSSSLHPSHYVNVITVFEIKFDDCVAHAIRLLYENNVSGAAIIDPADSASKKSMDRDIGFIDFSSMVLWSLEVSDRTVSFIYICYQEIDKVRAASKEGNHGFFDMLEKNSHIGRTKVFFSLKK